MFSSLKGSPVGHKWYVGLVWVLWTEVYFTYTSGEIVILSNIIPLQSNLISHITHELVLEVCGKKTLIHFNGNYYFLRFKRLKEVLNSHGKLWKSFYFKLNLQVSHFYMFFFSFFLITSTFAWKQDLSFLRAHLLLLLIPHWRCHM